MINAGATQQESTDVGADGLKNLRAELDRIDERLLDTVRQRIACCVRIGHYKREHNLPVRQPHRIGIVQQRAARYAEAHGMDATFLCRLYDLIIGEACRVEDVVIDNALQTNPDDLS
jgi:chorismate mutase-like protein